jgi:ERCC4-type nuclease
MAFLIIDSREDHNGRGKPDPVNFVEKLIAEDNRKNEHLAPKLGGGKIKFVKKTINVGDYAIVLPGSTNALAAVFERKTWADLAGSIKDNRMTQQFKNMENIRRKTGCKVYYIIEGLMYRSDTTIVSRIPYKNLYAKLIHNSLRDIHFIQSRSPEHTCVLLLKYTRAIIKLRSLGEIRFGSTFNDKIQRLIHEYPEKKELVKLLEQDKSAVVGGSPADMSELHEKVIKENSDIVINIFRQLPGAGLVIASELVKHVTLREVFTGKKSATTEKIANIKCPSGMSIGFVKARKIVNAPETVYPKMLTQIRGVSDKIADFILQKYSMKSILLGETTGEDLAELVFSKRRIGVIGKRIAEVLSYGEK